MFRIRSKSLLRAVGLLLLVALLSVSSARANERGRPFVQAFAVRDYGEHSQNWCAVQDRAGTLYVGNNNVVLAYDGLEWRSLEVGGQFIRGLALDADDRVWVGGVNELGYLAVDGRGGRAFVSLRERLPEAERDFRDIRRVVANHGGVYFLCDDRVLRWHDGRVTVERFGAPAYSCELDGEVIVSVVGQPLRTLRGGEWSVVSEAPELANRRVVGAARLPDGAALFGTVQHGLWRLAEGRVEPFVTEVDAALRSGMISHLRRLRDGTLAIGRRAGGLLLLDARGRLLHSLASDNGTLPVNAVITTFEDRAGDLWALLGVGLARITWPATLTAFDRANGFGRGGVLAGLRHEGRFYAGTTDGLFVLEPGDPAASPPRAPRFVAVPGIPNRVWQLASSGRTLLVGTERGLFRVEPGGLPQLLPMPAETNWAICLHVPRGAPDRLYVGTIRGVHGLRRDASGRWLVEEGMPALDAEVRRFAESADGSLWAGTLSHGLVRIRGLPGTASAGEPRRVERFSLGAHGLPARSGRSYPPAVGAWGGDVVFAVEEGLFVFDAARGEFREHPVSRARPAAARGHQAGFSARGSDRCWIRIVGREEGRKKAAQLWSLTASGEWRRFPVAAAEAVGENVHFWEDPAAPEIVWLGGSEGLLRAELPAALAPLPPLTTRIVRVLDRAQQPLPLGGGLLELPHRANALTFFVAAERFDATGLQFQTRLEGRDDAWSPASPNRALTFSGLLAGRYALQARAQDAEGRISEPVTFAFRVRPPWWETWWMLGVYSLAALGGLFAAFQWRLGAVRRRNDKLEALVAARTEELRANEQQLRAARDGAEAASRAKTTFLANMSHELRTPLNAVLGYAQIVLRDPRLPADHRRRVQAIAQGGDHLLSMINEVLDLAKIEADKVEIAPRPTSLPRLLAALSEMFQLRGTERGLAFGFRQLTPLPASVLADEGRLRQVLINLLENAVKFTPAGGRIDLEVGRVGERIRFGVRDTGAGVASDQLQAIFRPFHQAAIPSLAQQGAGLGLAISQRLVGLMGGAIQVESLAGRGSHFWFEIALPEVAAQQLSRDPFGSVIIGCRGPRRRVLVADDEATNRHVLREMLEPLGFDCVEAADGEAAVAAASAAPPDVVLMDIRMPRLDGLGAARQLRAQSATAAIKIVAISASVFASDKEDAIAHGCDEFLPKPFREAQLLEVLGRLLGLEWTHAPAVIAAAAPSGPTDEVPDREELATLAALAEQGDVLALRARLAELRARAPGCATFVGQLDELASEFQMTRLSEAIARARRTVSA